jgi:hypothetical protein
LMLFYSSQNKKNENLVLSVHVTVLTLRVNSESKQFLDLPLILYKGIKEVKNRYST